LALSALITKEVAATVKDVDTLDMLADLFSSVGDNLTLVAGQRERCAQSKSETESTPDK